MCGRFFSGYVEEEKEDSYTGRDCYSFNENMMDDFDDEKCMHCRHYLTLQCKYIHEFMDEDGES